MFVKKHHKFFCFIHNIYICIFKHFIFYDMKTLKHSVLTFSLAFLMGACTSSKQEETQGMKNIHVNVDNIRNDIKLSEFAEATLIPLPTSDDLLIGNINRIRTSDKSICVSDGNALYRFSRSGKFLGKIEKKGQGPDEYAAISDFVIADDENVWVLPNGKTSLMLFSWDNQLVKDLKIESSYSSRIYRMGDKLILNNGNFMTENNKHSLQMVDMNTGEVTNRFIPIDEYKAQYLYLIETNNFHPGKNDTVCYFSTIHNDTVYRVTPNTYHPYQAFDWGGKNIPADFYHQDFMDIMAFNEGLSDGKIYGITFQLHSDNYQWAGYTQKGKGAYSALLPKDAAKQAIIQKVSIDALNGFPMAITGDGWTDNKYVTGHNEIVFILQPMNILEYIDEHAPETMDDIKKKIQYTSDDQNPVLMIVNLK